MGKALTVSILSVASLAIAPAAAGAARQSFAGTLTSTLPATSSGYRLAIDYVNPEDPNRKPYAVERVVQTLNAGARIDTSVPPRCEASDAELVAQGASACPASTRVGGGELAVDIGMGVGPLPRVIENRVTVFNADHELILFSESTNTEGRPVRTATRTRVSERTLTSQVPPIPAFPPPDPFLAIKRVRLELPALSRGTGARRRHFITTPSSCPASRAWTNTGTFTYRDGVTETVASRSPCVAADRRRPRIRVSGVPRRCARRDFTARVRIFERSRLRGASLRLDGRLLARTRRKRFSRRIRARRARAGVHRLTVTAVDAAGNRATRTARFSRCRRTATPRLTG